MFPGHRTLAALFLLAAVACTTDSPEEQVKQAFAACVQDLEKGDGTSALEKLSPGFEGPDGMDRGAASLFLRAILKQGRLGITVLHSRVKAHPQEATQEISVVVTQRGGQSLLPDESSRQDFLITWERRKGVWRVKALRPVR
ncbi:MAG: hypothetical protein H6Q00_2075 [Holophagaceae bacterium]|nr:hypothetical protein [Holophagaceae bacterium]